MSPCKDATNFSQMSIMKKPRTGLGPTTSSKSLASTQDEKFYDGLGGHSKPDLFPTRANSQGFKLGKRPKGVSKPKASAAFTKQNSASAKAIDKYFNFDTP